MNRPALALALACLATPALAMQEPQCGPAATPKTNDPMTCSYTYAPGQTYRLPLTLLSTVTIVFGLDEDVSQEGGAANPDKQGFSVAPMPVFPNRLLFKPNRPDRAGRLVNVPVFGRDKRFGEERDYNFILDTRDEKLDLRTGIVRIVFHYPGDAEKRAAEDRRKRAAEAAERARKARDDAGRAQTGDILNVAHFYGPRNHRYTYRAGTPADEAMLVGFRISDNGHVTSFEWPANLDGAAIFSVDTDGTERMVMRAPRDGGTTIIPRTASQWRLRRGNHLVCLLNQAWDPIGINPGTHTISPRVGVRPRLQNTRADP